MLALATRTAPNMLILDEPTNHLDIDARESLIEAINDFDGAVVLVSHDTHLVKMVADQLWLVAGGTVTPFEGDIDEYQAKLLRERSGRPAKEGKGKKDKKQKAAAGPCAVVAEKPKRGPLKRALEEAEKAIAKLTRERTELEAKLADPATWSGPPTVAAELQKEKLRLERELAHAEHEWLVAQEASRRLSHRGTPASHARAPTCRPASNLVPLLPPRLILTSDRSLAASTARCPLPRSRSTALPGPPRAAGSITLLGRWTAADATGQRFASGSSSPGSAWSASERQVWTPRASRPARR